MDFYTIVSISAILLLIISLTTIGVVITNSMSTKTFPSYINPCPDYWTLSADNTKCIRNNINVGTTNMKQDLVLSKYATLEQKCGWSSNYNVKWDGITNNNSITKCEKVA
jgi:hypothetical protein